jgi:Ca2+-binding EF-hand superfamily protein
MTTYDGKGYKYDSKGKEVVNREPPVSKHIVEKLYRIHRSNVINCEPLTDCHVIVPEFLTNMAWKKLGENKRKKDQLIQNEKIYQRISKVENNRSRIVTEIEEHVKRVEDVKGKMQKLSEQGRLKHLLKIQRDNAVILERIERARPSITSDSIAEWYKPHVLYKDGRRSDVTAGHIMHNMKGLLPGKLPPLESSVAGSTSLRSISSRSVLDRNKGGGSSASVYSSVGMGSVSSMPLSMSDDNGYGYLSALRNSISPYGLGTADDGTPLRPGVSPKASGQSRTAGKAKSNKLSRTASMEVKSKLPAGSMLVRSTIQSPLAGSVPLQRPHSAGELKHSSSVDNMNDNASNAESSQELDSSIASNDSDSENESESVINEIETENELVILITRPFPLPYDSKNCQVSICCLAEPDEMLHIRVVMAGDPSIFLGERIIHKNKALEIVNSTNNLAQQAAINDDLQALRAVLINMFKEADDDGNGFLTFDEFQVLLEKVDLGISSQEMRFVISEADENENGVVDYCEFVPLAVDMIQSFRARNRAKTQTSQEDSEIDEVIMQSLSQSEISSITETCLAKIREVDTKSYGVLKPNELRRCLNSVANIFVNEKEITMICQSLPRDPFNRCIYSGLREVVAKIRFMTLKNNYVEARGSELHKYLLERCREEEQTIRQKRETADDVETGRLPFRAMTNLLQSSSRLSLSRLQVMVIMAEASAVEGMVDYYQFCPVVAKTIEIMFEPKTLRQRAELIEKTDLSPEALLSGLSTDEFKQKLHTLFKSYDIDHSGALDKDELKSCLQALDFHLSDGEIAALRVAADLRTTGALSMDDFVNFFTQNLLQLEREKHIQILQKALHVKGPNNMKRQQQIPARVGGVLGMMGAGNSSIIGNTLKQDVVTVEQYSAHLETFFKLADSNGSGLLERAEFESLLMTLDINISPFQLECIMSEMDLNHDNKISYREFIPIAADLLAVSPHCLASCGR